MIQSVSKCESLQEVSKLCDKHINEYTYLDVKAMKLHDALNNTKNQKRNCFNLENSIDAWIAYLKQHDDSIKEYHQICFTSYVMYCIANFLPNRSEPFPEETPIDNPAFFYPIIKRLIYQYNAMAEYFVIKQIIDIYPDVKLAPHRTLDCVFGIDIVAVYNERVALIHVTKESYYKQSLNLKGKSYGACRNALTGKNLKRYNNVRDFSDSSKSNGELTHKHQAIKFNHCDSFKYQLINDEGEPQEYMELFGSKLYEHLFEKSNTYPYKDGIVCNYIEHLRQNASKQDQEYHYIPERYTLITGDEWLQKLPKKFKKWFDDVAVQNFFDILESVVVA